MLLMYNLYVETFKKMNKHVRSQLDVVHAQGCGRKLRIRKRKVYSRLEQRMDVERKSDVQRANDKNNK